MTTFLFSCYSSEKIFSRTQFLMGTVVEVKAVSNDPECADMAISDVFERMREIERQMTAKSPGSWIDRIESEAAGRPLSIPDDILYVIENSLKYAELTEGAFDITIGAVTKFWHFDKDIKQIPDKDEINKALNLVDFRKINLDRQKGLIELEVLGMSLDLGAAAKGYAVDEGIKRLKEYGIIAGLVNAGGDLKAYGKKPGGESWNIGIQDPDNSERVIGSILLNDEALVTSGDYERYIIFKGQKYHHILDPKTGWPARDCKSVSIGCESALRADILSTAVFVMGPEKGIRLIERLSGIEGMIIDSAGNIKVTSGWKDLLKLDKMRK